MRSEKQLGRRTEDASMERQSTAETTASVRVMTYLEKLLLHVTRLGARYHLGAAQINWQSTTLQ